MKYGQHDLPNGPLDSCAAIVSRHPRLRHSLVCSLKYPMFEIEIANHQSAMEIDPEQIRNVVESTLRAEQVCRAQISIGIMDDQAIHEVNRTHLNHDYPTDVISFLYDSEVEDESLHTAGTFRGAGLSLDGEVVVSTETAMREAKRHHWSAQAEVTLYLVHGLLHLCGYDDLTDEEQVLMRAREREILQIWDLTPHYDF